MFIRNLKSDKEKKRILLSGLLFVIGMAVTLGLVLFFFNQKKEKAFPRDNQKQIVFLGDSNVAFRREDTDIPELMADKLGMTTYNCAMGGTTAARIDHWNRFDSFYEKCCLYELKNMMLAQSLLPAEDNMAESLKQYERTEDKLKLINDMDFSRVDYLFLSYGMNDYLLGTPADDPVNPFDNKSYAGALREAVLAFREAFPRMKIIITSITYYDVGNGEDSFNYDFGGGTLKDYRNAGERVAKEFENVYFLDNLTLLGIHSENWQEYMSDKMHLNGKSQEMWAENAAELIRSIEGNSNE